jgi:2-oxoglutarate ferredoxin oxidoreductase subunit beta
MYERLERPMEFELPPEGIPWHRPNEWALRADRLPHIWCSGCGIGIAVNAFVAALGEVKMDLHRLAIVSSIGCMGSV